MKRQNLKISQKKEIVKEKKRSQQCCQNRTNLVIEEWEKREFNLATAPRKYFMYCIPKDVQVSGKNSSYAAGSACSMYRRKEAKHVQIERDLYYWVCDMRNKRRCISGAIIQAKAMELVLKSSEQLQRDSQKMTQFSEGQLEGFKMHWSLKAFKLHAEAGDVNVSNIDNQSKRIHRKIGEYAFKDGFNCDESGIYYQMASDRTISLFLLPWSG